MPPDSFSEPPDPPTPRLSIVTGYLLSRESNTIFFLHCFKIISDQAPICLSDFLHPYTPSQLLRSSPNTRVIRMPLFRLECSGQRSFSYRPPPAAASSLLPSVTRPVSLLSCRHAACVTSVIPSRCLCHFCHTVTLPVSLLSYCDAACVTSVIL